MFLNLLTSPLVHSQPLWQDHLRVSQSEAQPFAPDFSPQHLNRQTTPQPALSPLAISLPATNCLRLLHLSIRTLGRWNTKIFSSVHRTRHGHLKSCMLMLLNSPVQMLQPELQTWLCEFGSLPLMVSQGFSSSHSLSISKSCSHSISNSHSYSVNSGPCVILGQLLQVSLICLLHLLQHSSCCKLLFGSTQITGHQSCTTLLERSLMQLL